MDESNRDVRRRRVGAAALAAAVAVLAARLALAADPLAAFGQRDASDGAARSASQTSPSDAPATPAVDDVDDVLKLAEQPLETLTRQQIVAPALSEVVSTVSREVSTVGKSPAAVYVITGEMIRRSGVRSIPEALRMAPGVQVARIDANKWAVTVRGFNSQYANKLLVQIDGRTVYSPLFAGVFWDVQDVLLEDVERIEIIRGPGATVWGANAVNGIINVITKPASETVGAFAEGGAGTEERGFASARVGGRLGEDGHYRIYGKWFEREGGFAADGLEQDDWQQGRGGFRLDWNASCADKMTLQGDFYGGTSGQRNLFASLVPPFAEVVSQDERVRGGNLLYRWTHDLGDESSCSTQVYYDRTERDRSVRGGREDRDIVDVDFQYRLPWGDWHDIIWGCGYRNTKDRILSDPLVVTFTDNKLALDLFSYFVQDQITLREDLLYLTLGSKFEHSDYSPFEIQPTARLLWTPSNRQSIWASVSRAVRTPTRAELGFAATGTPQIPGVPVFPQATSLGGLESEDLLAFEAGIRVQPTDRLYWDLAVFHHNYDNLVAQIPGALTGVAPPFFVPIVATNANQAQSYGFELAANYQINPCWKLHGSYSFLRVNMELAPGVPAGSVGDEGNAPRNQVYLQSSWDLGSSWELDVMYRYIDRLPAFGIASYNALDARLAWRPTRNLECAVVGRHLLDASHPEFAGTSFGGTLATEVQAEVYGSITWRY